jgi:thioredoxin 1
MKNVTGEELKKIITENEVVLVDYYAEWCGPCKQLIPRLESLESEYANAVFAKVDVDANMEYAKELGVRSVPTVMVLKNGEVIHRSSGANTPEYYKEILNNA